MLSCRRSMLSSVARVSHLFGHGVVIVAMLLVSGVATAAAESDLLWRNFLDGRVYRQQINSFTIAAGTVVYTEPNTNWLLVADGDFDGDGTVDVVYRNIAT